eukprot:SAG25_NODE_944_length_4650_cov_9.607119_5_plen_60_part_00
MAVSVLDPNVPVSSFQEKGVSTIIWANHNMRGAIVAMVSEAAMGCHGMCALPVRLSLSL